MRVSAVVASALLLLSAIVACSLGALDGFSGGEGTGDGGTDSGTLPSGDATTDVDAGGGDGAVGTSFCAKLATPVTACVDFDDAKLPPAKFNEEVLGGQVEIDGEGKDGTRGLVSRVPAGAPNNGAACISLLLDGPRTGLVLEGDVRFDAIGSNNYDVFNFNAGPVELGLSVTGTKFFIEEDGLTGDGGEIDLSTGTTATAKSVWQHFRFVVTIDATASHCELFVDGTSQGKHNGVGSTIAGTTKFEIGDCSLVGAGSWTVHYDNVVLSETK